MTSIRKEGRPKVKKCLGKPLEGTTGTSKTGRRFLNKNTGEVFIPKKARDQKNLAERVARLFRRESPLPVKNYCLIRRPTKKEKRRRGPKEKNRGRSISPSKPESRSSQRNKVNYQ